MRPLILCKQFSILFIDVKCKTRLKDILTPKKIHANTCIMFIKTQQKQPERQTVSQMTRERERDRERRQREERRETDERD